MSRARYRYEGPAITKPPLVIGDYERLWLLRMAIGEGGYRSKKSGLWKCSTVKVAALCWAIVCRWFLWPGRRHYETFVDLMRAFSQPINPRWAEGGDKARAYAGTRFASPKRLKRRAAIIALQETDIAAETVDAVDAFIDGVLRPPLPMQRMKRRATNWASLKSTPEKFPDGCDIQGDWFFSDPHLTKGKVVVGD